MQGRSMAPDWRPLCAGSYTHQLVFSLYPLLIYLEILYMSYEGVSNERRLHKGLIRTEEQEMNLRC
jgi:hypothetical protein